MKKFKLIFCTLTISVAICGAYASKVSDPEIGYIKLTQDGSPVETDCQRIGLCANEGEFRCRTLMGAQEVDLWKVNGTACDAPISHNVDEPIEAD